MQLFTTYKKNQAQAYNNDWADKACEHDHLQKNFQSIYMIYSGGQEKTNS